MHICTGEEDVRHIRTSIERFTRQLRAANDNVAAYELETSDTRGRTCIIHSDKPAVGVLLPCRHAICHDCAHDCSMKTRHTCHCTETVTSVLRANTNNTAHKREVNLPLRDGQQIRTIIDVPGVEKPEPTRRDMFVTEMQDYSSHQDETDTPEADVAQLKESLLSLRNQ